VRFAAEQALPAQHLLPSVRVLYNRFGYSSATGAAMHEPLLERIRDLERSNRRWRLIALVLGLAFASVFATGVTFITILSLRVSRDAEDVMRAEQDARQQLERALVERQRAEQAVEEARRRANENP
jgi:hypothetical protein